MRASGSRDRSARCPGAGRGTRRPRHARRRAPRRAAGRPRSPRRGAGSCRGDEDRRGRAGAQLRDREQSARRGSRSGGSAGCSGGAARTAPWPRGGSGSRRPRSASASRRTLTRDLAGQTAIGRAVDDRARADPEDLEPVVAPAEQVARPLGPRVRGEDRLEAPLQVIGGGKALERIGASAA
jgi:hypothetical protein